MGYIFLLTALVAGATKGYCGKKTSGFVNEYKDAMLANSIRMVFCTLIGLCMVIYKRNRRLTYKQYGFSDNPPFGNGKFSLCCFLAHIG